VREARVALIQNRWRPEPELNLRHVLELIESVPGPLDLVCLPEFFLGPPWYFPGQAHMKGVVDDTVPGRVTARLGEVARRRGCYISCGTLVERSGERYYNTSAVVGPDGEVAGVARKMHRYSAEIRAIEAGDRPLLVETPFGTLGVCICSDFWIPEVPRMLALQGAEIICIPGASLATNLEITRPCIQANSTFNVCYTLYTSIVGSATGTRGGREFSIEMAGYSTAASPNALLATLDREEGVVRVTLDMEALRGWRQVDPRFKQTLYWCLQGRRPELYGALQGDYVGKSDLEALLREHLDR
jgi:predicted amidohydrolase